MAVFRYAAQDSTVASLDKDEIESFKKAFALFDKDSSGSIQTDELRAVINSLGQDVPGHVMKQMISVMDVDNSGEIDFNEFIKLMLTIPKLDDRFIIVKDIKRVQFDAGTKARIHACAHARAHACRHARAHACRTHHTRTCNACTHAHTQAL